MRPDFDHRDGSGAVRSAPWGIVVDDQRDTDSPRIWAAGDVTEHP
jgi:pyruvate/2-oxoglutarate dehydrogenase complex dihydrolipoamide dehydrogenase (E3) component